MDRVAHYNILADLFRYPDSQLLPAVEFCRKLVCDGYPGVDTKMNIFAEYVKENNIDALQELYTKTFEIQAICYLDLGYVMFGEDYKRGVFLVNMKQEQIKIGNDCGTELPDNLANMLTFFAKSSDNEIVNELAIKILLPGIAKMIQEFEQTRIEIKLNILKSRHYAIIQEELYRVNVYKHALEVLDYILNIDFAEVKCDVSTVGMLADQQFHQSFFNKSSVNAEVKEKYKMNQINNN